MVESAPIQIPLDMALGPPLALHQAMHDSRCMFCGARLPARYTPQYSKDSQLPINMPICSPCGLTLSPHGGSD